MVLESLIKKVNIHFDVDITENTRKRKIVMARAAFYWLSLNKTKHSMEQVGEIVGRDRTSVIYSMKNFNDWINGDLHFKNEFERLRKIVFNELSVQDLIKKKTENKYKFLKIAKDLLIIELNRLRK